jgi:uncharacterized membrane protein
MRYYGRRWEEDREWRARRFAAGCVGVLVAVVLLSLGCPVLAVSLGFVGVGLVWSAR